jgi:hypothetical protein
VLAGVGEQGQTGLEGHGAGGASAGLASVEEEIGEAA